MTPILISAACVYLTILAATIYLTRPAPRRLVGAVLGGVVVMLVGVGVEAIAHARGWWRYTSDDTPIGPVLMYPLLVVVFAFLALIGWIIMRRFGGAGLAVFLGVLAVVGTLRDYLIAEKLMGLVVFAPGVLLAIVDGCLWAGLTALAIAVMRFASGPARIDRTPSESGESV
jgi:hypothetical protein